MPIPSGVLGIVKWTSKWWLPRFTGATATQSWDIPTWAWVAAVALGIVISQAFAWYEQSEEKNRALLRVEELSGPPGVSLECVSTPGGRNNLHKFTLRNDNDLTAVNISAIPIEISIPERIRNANKEMRDSFGVDAGEPPSRWTIVFEEIQRLARGECKDLLYRIDGVGALQTKDLEYVLGNGENIDWENGYVSRCPLTVRMWSFSDPSKGWDLRYRLRFNMGTHSLSAVFVERTQVLKEDPT